MTLTYLATDKNGRRVSGCRSASSETVLRNELSKEKLTVSSVFKSATRCRQNMYALVSPKELAVFCREMSVLFFSHITVLEGLGLLLEQNSNRELKAALIEIRGHMENGISFSDAAAMYPHIFTQYLCSAIQIGEKSGTLDDTFTSLAVYFEKEDRIRKKVRSALTYPLILTALMGAIIILLVLKILPMFNDILVKMGGEMPAATNIILQASLFINKYIWVFSASTVFIACGLIVFFRTSTGKRWRDALKIKLPLVRFVSTRIITSRFSRGLAVLLKSGVSLVNALDDVRMLVDNKHLETGFFEAVKQIRDGENLSGVFNKMKLFPPLFIRMLTVGQSTGHLDEMLDRSAGIFDSEVDDAVEKITAMLEPSIIILLSLVVGIILISVMLPMISIMNAIG